MTTNPFARLTRAIALLSLCPVVGATPVFSEEQQSLAMVAKLKTAYLFNIAKFVEFPEDQANINLCLNADRVVGSVATKLSGRELTPGRTITVIDKTGDASTDCHIVYHEGEAESTRIDTLNEAVTISDVPGALSAGYVIELFLQRDKLRFGVNHERLKTAPFRISAKLLRLARKRG